MEIQINSAGSEFELDDNGYQEKQNRKQQQQTKKSCVHLQYIQVFIWWVLLQVAFTWHLLGYVLHSSIFVKKKKGKEEKRLKMGFGFYLEHTCTKKTKQIQKTKQTNNKQAHKPKQNKRKYANKQTKNTLHTLNKI